ncbi:hypothetical protein [Paradevosia shaoguanensis]|uniref:hypothetical protein n=1 Tax=Paradevosia shaoguanensis TaxID=1335043 RepID=UPI003C777818
MLNSGLRETTGMSFSRNSTTVLLHLSNTLRATFALSLVLMAIAAIAAGLSHILNDPVRAAQSRELVAEVWRDYLVPEPEERAAYIAAVLAAFPLAILIASMARRKAAAPVGLATAMAWPFAAALLLSCGFLELSFVRTIFAPTGDAGIPLWLQTSSAILVVAAFLAWYLRNDGRIWHVPARQMTVINVALAVFVVAAVGFLRVRSADMVYGDVHFEATFYSISQVVGGKTVLADFPAQYGLYAELLGPFLKLTGVTILGFTTFLSLLFDISIIALCVFCSFALRSVALRITAVLATFLFVGSTWRVLGASIAGIEEYYQLWPVRSLFPTLMLAFFAVIHRRGLPLTQVACLAVVLGVGMIWNLDWGVPAFGALVSFFLVRLICGAAPARMANILRLALTAIIPVVVVALFAGYLTLKSGGQIHWGDWLKYQVIFYSSGFGMLPLPLFPHPWMVVIAIYLYGLLHGIAMQIRRCADFQSDAMLVLSILGIGIFTYYQGRSHDTVLTMVMWPSILIAFMAADQTLRAARLGRLPRLVGWATMPTLVFGVMASFTLLFGLPNLFAVAKTTIGSVSPDPTTARAINVAFVRSKTGGERSAVILDPGQSILFVEAGLSSAVKGPGIIEMLLIEDRDRIVNDTVKNKVAHVFVRADIDGRLPVEYRPLLEAYRIESRSEAGLLYLVPN